MKLNEILKICYTDRYVKSLVIVPDLDNYQFLYNIDVHAVGECIAKPKEDITIPKPVCISDVQKFIAATKLVFTKLFVSDDVQLMVVRSSGSATVLYESATGMNVLTFTPQRDPDIYNLVITGLDMKILLESLSSGDNMQLVTLSPTIVDIPLLSWRAYENPNNDHGAICVNIPVNTSGEVSPFQAGSAFGTFNYDVLISIFKANKTAEYCTISIFIDMAMTMTFFYKDCVNKITIFSN